MRIRVKRVLSNLFPTPPNTKRRKLRMAIGCGRTAGARK
jgi:hypothetical protein